MTFSEWQQLTPEAAAREVHRRVAALPAAQQRAAIADLAPEAELVAAFRAARTPASGSDHLLAGVPCFVKDLFDIAGRPTRAGSTFLPELRPMPTRDGAAVAAMRRAGAVIVGKTHLHEFAYGITGENPHYGDCEHPRFPGRTTGGSSSGSAAVVAAGVAPLALGTDTGGSVRVPAAFCGIFGFRLTPGDPWIRDAFPLAPSFDTAGWFTAAAGDMQAATTALVGGFQPRERTLRGCYFEPVGVDKEVSTACQNAAKQLGAAFDVATQDALRAGFAGALDAYHTTVAAEAWAVHAAWADRYRERYDPVVWPRLIRGRNVDPAQVAAAAQARTAIRSVWREFFAAFDYLLLPASPAPALTKAECTLENRNRVITLTAPASIGGYPVLTVPIPLADGLSTGLQIVIASPQSPAVPWALEHFS
jgi:amidase/aspartyl-tRNA(Asn)/glutamyl-tRNA(Gln) amidotransferase subunit A